MTFLFYRTTPLLTRTYGLAWPALLITLLIGPSCRNESGGLPQGRPAAERTSVHYMLPVVQSAHKEVVDAENMLHNDAPDLPATEKSLEKARRSLAALEWCYLPATEARENVYNAYLEHLAGHPEKRNSYLVLAKRGLFKIAEQSDSQVEPYIKDLTDRIETVQFHIHDGEPVQEELESLCETFQLHLLKAQLVLDESAFGEQDLAVTINPKEVDHVEQK
jgi:hypothetical protein